MKNRSVKLFTCDFEYVLERMISQIKIFSISNGGGNEFKRFQIFVLEIGLEDSS